MQQTEATLTAAPVPSTEKNGGLYPPMEILQKQKKSQPKRRHWLGAAGWFLMVAVLTIAFMEPRSLDKVWGDWIFYLGLALIFLTISIPINIILHEVGHMLAGLFCGMRLLVLSVGRWRFERSVQGFRLRRATPIAGISGLAMMVPDVTHTRASPKRDHVIIFLGGPVMNLACAALALVAAYALSLHLIVNVFLYTFGAMALFVGVLNLMPLKIQNWRTDGLQIIDVFRHKEDILMQNIQYLSGLALTGIRARQWPPELIPQEQVAGDGALPFFTRISAQNARLIYALDCDDEKMARPCVEWLAKHFDQIPDGLRQLVAVLIASYAAQMCGDKDLLAAWRPWCDGGLTDTGAVCHWLDAELAWLNGDALKARKYIQQAQAAMSTVMSRVDQQMLEESLSSLQLRMRGGHQEICHTGS
ncbi:hypothetical protein CUZ56_00917 [Saezia sanguinis]|uniref:Peptidase M50 domain-containing protein n=2 Tax=Saezia sanguinis TaxID=1965230 RepID=A0A433SE16_9BURK|nr:hypothetical protein CUZ56_00917 [Saezia sanguinis]